MDTGNLPIIAGITSTIMFASGNIPMLIKVYKSQDLRSYSLSHIVMSNIGNGVHWVYIASLPFGPVWALHAFYTVTTAFMLALYLKHRANWEDIRRVTGEFVKVMTGTHRAVTLDDASVNSAFEESWRNT
jgi:hypothetical protein